MVNRKVKFKISVKELSVEFEGDIQTAERIQQQVTGALNNLATSPNRLLSSGEQRPAEIIDVSPSRKRRRRRSRAIDDSGAEESHIEAGPINPGEDEAARRPMRRVGRGDGASALITSLASSGFFNEHRTVGQIRDQLSKLGHSFKTNELTPPLGRLTRGGVLQRDKNSDKQWAYFVRS